MTPLIGRWTLIVSVALAICWLSTCAAVAQSNKDCLSCHNDTTLFKEVHGKKFSMNVDPKRFKASVHADLDCVDCHRGVKADDPHEPRPGPVSCGRCHDEQVKAYAAGRHAKAARQGDDKTANCKDCHGAAHDILSHNDPLSKTWRGNIPRLCGGCHGEKLVMTRSGISTSAFLSYQQSVHGKAVAGGKTTAAICSDCHKSHDVRRQDDPESPISRGRISGTCGGCHRRMAREYNASVHGKAIARGNGQAPSCADCHGIHLIKSPDDPTSPVAEQGVSKTCGKCHESVRLTQEFGVQGSRLTTYGSSYHGMASGLGSAAVANCASCHGVHKILPSGDPESTINPKRLAKTCGNCHPGASENFVQGKVHLEASYSLAAPPGTVGSRTSTEEKKAAVDMGSLITVWVRTFYMWLIVVVVGGMLLHNFLGWRRHVLDHVRNRPRAVQRLTRSHRLQHGLLVASFVALVITGFALKFPQSWLAVALGSSEFVRRTGHRVAAVILVTVSCYHVLYLVFTREGRLDLRDMWPRFKDLGDFIGNARYWLALSGARPKIARFGYVEKAEYWALAWGTVIMGVTGYMLWFPVQSLFGYLPRWAIDAATAVHFYEAILATVAIPVWHLYHVMFSPDVYPINWSFVDGYVTDDHFRQEHALAWEEMHGSEKSSGVPEEPDSPEPPPTQPETMTEASP